ELVRIVAFDHPVSPEDLEQVRDELDRRPEETRDVTVVALGAEQAALDWLTDWNAYRKSTSSPNRMSLVELRTDPKYGKIIAFEPPFADVSIERSGATLVITVNDFVSPSIIARLTQQQSQLEPKIGDWRAMVESIAIDSEYDGSVFKPSVFDIPEEKADFVTGKYETPAPPEQTTVRARMTDMLGGDAYVTETV